MNMKKYYYLSIVALFLIVFVSCTKDTDLENHEKYLAAITIYEHEYDFGKPTEKGELYEEWRYNQNGCLTSKTTNYYNSLVDGRLNYRYEYTYDSNSHLIEENKYFLGLLDGRTFYSNDSEGKVLKKEIYDEDGDISEIWEYEYYADNRVKKEIEREPIFGDDFGYIHEYSYSGNNVTKVSYSLDDKELFGTFFWEYDEQGNMLRETWTNGETGKSTVQFEGVYEYNTDGRLIKSTTHGMFERELTYKEYSYDEEGHITIVRLSNSYSTRKSELRYNYIWK